MKSPRLLILSASTGNGHMSAAHAIAEEAHRAALQAQVVDVLDFTSPAFRTWYRGGYEQLVRKKPAVWGHLYRSSDRPLFNYSFQTGLDYAFTRGIRRCIADFRPDWVVCTHSLPQPRLVPLRREFGFREAVVVTDLYVHRMWLRGRPDFFFVPQTWTREVLMRRRPRLGRNSEATGIPIHPAFGEEVGPKRRWGSFIQVLVTSGGIGGGPMVETVRAARSEGAHVWAVSGRNEAARRLLTSEFQSDSEVEVLGQIDQSEMAARMRAAHLLVAKPGGLTTFEALATGTPFGIYWPFLIPGQEEGNARFLADCGAGQILRSPDDLRKLIGTLKADPEVGPQMSACAQAHASPDAAAKIVRTLREL